MGSTTVQRAALLLYLNVVLAVLVVILVNGEADHSRFVELSEGDHHARMLKMEAFKLHRRRRELASSPSPASAPQGIGDNGAKNSRVYQVTGYGADPTGKLDSTEALENAIAAAFNGPSAGGSLMNGIANLGGAYVNLEGGTYVIRKPLRFPKTGAGNLVIGGGTLRASDDFPSDGYLIDLSAPSSSSASSSYNYEYITLRDLMLDCNYKGGGIAVVRSLRTSIDNCYIVHFNTDGILVQSGHETYIRNSFLGQHITAGGDSGERKFSGTAINLMGNDNAVTDVVIFSAAVGVMISGQANTLNGVHCYNKATGWGGTGIYLKLPNLTQIRIINCYLDYTGIVAEDPVQLTISNSFFLGDAYILLKSVKGVTSGLTIVDNMFSGSNNGVDIIQLDQSKVPFKQIDQVVVDRNNAKGMNIRSTVAKGSVQGNGTSWTVDFSSKLLFPNLINHVRYSLSAEGNSFPNHILRKVTQNRIVVESDVDVTANLYAIVDQTS